MFTLSDGGQKLNEAPPPRWIGVPSVTSPNPLPSVTPSQVITRLQMLSQGARIVMLLLLGTGSVLLILSATLPARPASTLTLGLHFLQGGVTMLIGVGALAGHRAMVEQEQRTQALLAKYEQELEEKIEQTRVLVAEHECKVDERVNELRRISCEVRRNVEAIREIEQNILDLAARDELSDRRCNGHHQHN